MPSSPGYVRDYKQEAKYHARPEQKRRRAMRNKAHRTLEKVMGREIKGDVDHRVPLSKGGSNSRSNLRVQSKSENRSYKRTSSGAVA